MKTIMLVDMDYFFVACEELRHPEIRNVPAIVGSDPKGGAGRGVVMTCNYNARKYGIRSGMPISAAYRIKPDAVYMKLDYEYYEKISEKIMRTIKTFGDKFEQVSIDEAYIDVTKRVEGRPALEYAEAVKKAVFENAGIKCSIGIGPNKLIAKIACEKAKPDGIKIVEEKDAKSFIEKMSVDELYGVGRKTAERLRAMGYETVGQLAKVNMAKMVGEFGSMGAELVRYANGVDDSEITENYAVKSIGREFTFEKDTDDMNEVEREIGRLGNDVIEDVKKGGFTFKTVTLKLRYSDFTEHLHSRSIKAASEAAALINTAKALYNENVDAEKKIRKVGVRVSNLASSRGQKRIV